MLPVARRGYQPAWTLGNVPFEPDILLPFQYRSPSRIESPEHRLLAAVLIDAFDVIRRTAGSVSWRSHREREEVLAWAAEQEQPGQSPFALVALCQYLGVDPGLTREALERLAAERPLGVLELRPMSPCFRAVRMPPSGRKRMQKTLAEQLRLLIVRATVPQTTGSIRAALSAQGWSAKKLNGVWRELRRLEMIGLVRNEGETWRAA